MEETIKYQGKDFHISYMDKHNKYVLGTFSEDKITKKIKVDLEDLELEDKVKEKLIAINSKQQLD